MAERNLRTNSIGVNHPEIQERHGKRSLPEYQIWLQMKGRCHNPRNKCWPWYGAKGILVCERWRNSFLAFYEDMGPRPIGMTLERENTSKGYEPGNCRWASWDDQRRNKTNNRWYTFNGKTLIMADWEKELGMKHGLLRTRIDKYGWSIERALSTPVGAPRKNSRMLTFQGKTQPMAAWAREMEMNPKTLKTRIRSGWSLELALTTL